MFHLSTVSSLESWCEETEPCYSFSTDWVNWGFWLLHSIATFTTRPICWRIVSLWMALATHLMLLFHFTRILLFCKQMRMTYVSFVICFKIPWYSNRNYPGNGNELRIFLKNIIKLLLIALLVLVSFSCLLIKMEANVRWMQSLPQPSLSTSCYVSRDSEEKAYLSFSVKRWSSTSTSLSARQARIPFFHNISPERLQRCPLGQVVPWQWCKPRKS